MLQFMTEMHAEVVSYGLLGVLAGLEEWEGKHKCQ
jgi:hypothetical protein